MVQLMPAEKITFKYYDLMMAAFVVVLICSNLIGPAKLASINIGGEVFIFPPVLCFW
jgi:queuosine precursor transporter